jgi:hypothetical protein
MLKRMYTDNTLEAVFENACDCLYYGYGFTALNKCGLSDGEALRVWEKAKDYIGKQF